MSYNLITTYFIFCQQSAAQSSEPIAKKPRRSEEGHQMTGGDFEEEPDRSPP
jgi:hypothetical protein